MEFQATHSASVYVNLSQTSDGKFWLTVNGVRKGPYRDMAEATCDEVLGAELRHRYLVKSDAEYAAATTLPSEIASR